MDSSDPLQPPVLEEEQGDLPQEILELTPESKEKLDRFGGFFTSD